MSLSGAILASGAGALVFIPFSLKRPVTLLIASVAPTRGNFESGYFSEYHVHLPVSALTPIVDITFPRRSTTGTTYSEGLPDSECKRSGSPATAPYHACLLYTSDAADDLLCVDLGGRRIIKQKT